MGSTHGKGEKHKIYTTSHEFLDTGHGGLKFRVSDFAVPEGASKWFIQKAIRRLRGKGFLKVVATVLSGDSPVANAKVYALTRQGIEKLKFYNDYGCTIEACSLCHGKRSLRT